MFNFRETKFVPGFRVKEPVKEVPGFRLAQDGSIRQSSADVASSTDQSLLAPESWLQPWPTSKPEPTRNLAFLGGGLAGTLGDSTRPVLQDVEPAAAGDLKCQGVCSLGGDRGMTGAYREGRDNLCAKCLVKRLGYEDVPSSELPKLLEPWLIRGR
jgi:hypothetical protein